MKKMLVLNDVVISGGVEKLMYDMIMHWYKDIDITILSEFEDKDFHKVYPREIKSMHYAASWSLKNVKGFRRYEKRFQNYCKKKKIEKVNKMDFDILLSMKEGPITKLGSQINAKVKLCWVHLDYENAYWTNQTFGSAENEIDCMKKYKNVICVSQFIKKTIIEQIGDPGNLLVRYNPIDEKLIKRKSEEKCDDIAPKGDKIRFISVGRLHYQKGYDMLLKACAMLNADKYSYELYIIGEGEKEEDLLQYCNMSKDMKLDNITFMGYRDNPYKYLKTADWFISSSRYEGYSLVSQEATVLDIPIIATNCSGVSELLGDNGEYGIIADISVEDIYNKMKYVLDNPDEHKRYKNLISQRKSIISFDERLIAIQQLFDE